MHTVATSLLGYTFEFLIRPHTAEAKHSEEKLHRERGVGGRERWKCGTSIDGYDGEGPIEEGPADDGVRKGRGTDPTNGGAPAGHEEARMFRLFLIDFHLREVGSKESVEDGLFGGEAFGCVRDELIEDGLDYSGHNPSYRT